MSVRQDAAFAARGIAANILYRAWCSGRGRMRMHPFYFSGPRFCNAVCEQAWLDLQEQP